MPRYLTRKQAIAIAQSARSIGDCADLWRDPSDELPSDRTSRAAFDRQLHNARDQIELRRRYGRRYWWDTNGKIHW